MGSYILRRLLGIIPMLFAISIFTFFMMHMAPGDAFDAILNPKIKDVAALQAELRHANGLDQPLWWQYLHWIGNFLTGNFGFSMMQHQPVRDMLGPALKNTLILAVLAELFTLLVGIPVGIIQARYPYSKFDYTSSTGLFVLYSVPYYIFALMLIYVLAINLKIFPAQNAIGTGSSAGSLVDHLYHACLPALSIGLVSFVGYSRYTRSSMLDVSRRDYARTAYAKGLTERKVFFKHIFRNAMIPLVTQFGFDLGGLVGGAIIVEGLFAYQGMGLLTIQAVEGRDYPVIMATTIIFAVGVLLSNLIADILYSVVDPRIRYN